MNVLLITSLIFVALAGTGVVFTRFVASQIIGVSFFGILLALMFFVFQAPDVALSQITIGAVGLPMMVLLALARLRRNQTQSAQEREQ